MKSELCQSNLKTALCLTTRILFFDSNPQTIKFVLSCFFKYSLLFLFCWLYNYFLYFFVFERIKVEQLAKMNRNMYKSSKMCYNYKSCRENKDLFNFRAKRETQRLFCFFFSFSYVLVSFKKIFVVVNKTKKLHFLFLFNFVIIMIATTHETNLKNTIL